MYLYREKCRNINYINFSTRKIGLLSMADDLSITFELKHCAIIIYITIRSIVKRFDHHHDALNATIAFEDERWICKCVVAERRGAARRVEDPAGGPQSRDKVTAGSTLPSIPLPPPIPLSHPHSLPRTSLK